MSSPESNAAPAHEAAENVANPTGKESSGGDGANNSSGGGLWGWRNKLMSWRSGGSSGDTKDASAEAEEAKPASNSDPAKAADAAAEQDKEAKPTEEGASGPTAPTPTARPMNIWLRRALERQAESAVAEALRDGKPIPEVATSLATDASAATQHPPAERESATGDAPVKALVKASFADLMRQHREGVLPVTAQPPVKATKVVKKPKAAATAATAGSAAEATAPESAGATPTGGKKRKAKSDAPAEKESSEGPGPTPSAEAPTRADDKATESGKAVEKEPNEKTTAAAKTAEGGDAAPAAGAVHQGAVRKRAKAASPSNSASAKRTQDTSAAASAAATPTHTTTVKGRASLEELRARRNRGTAGSTHNTPTPSGGSADKSGAGDNNGAYNEGALDAISQLLLRYCLGDRPTPAADGAAASAAGAANSMDSSPAPNTSTTTTTELEFLNQLMELCEQNSLTAESLELLRELFQHVRVLPRPASGAALGGAAAADGDSAKKADAAGAGAAIPAEDTPAATAPPEIDAEAYREAARRREYVQQVIMVLINRLKQLKENEQIRQQRQQQKQEQQPAGPPQPIIGHGMPSIKVGGVPLTPLPTASASNSAAAPQQQQQQPSPSSSMLSYQEQMMRLAQWRAMADRASSSGVRGAEDEVAAAIAACSYPNPYAHLTVFSQHQPVAPPVGWPSSTTSRSSSGSAGARRGKGFGVYAEPPHNTNVAARLMPSPFPGAFPIIPPPSSTGRGGHAGGRPVESADAREDREMHELFQMIRAQLTQQPAAAGGSGGSHNVDGNSDSPGNGAAVGEAAPVEITQQERAVLRIVQSDFKQRMQQQQQQQQQQQDGDSPAPQAPTASTPPTASLDSAAGHHRTLFTPQSKTQEQQPLQDQEVMGDSPGARSTTAPAAEESLEDAAKEQPEKRTTATPLNLEAKPFVPGKAATNTAGIAAGGVLTPTPTAESTPTKTSFNYMAKPFTPGSGGNNSSSSNHHNRTPPANSTLRQDARPFVPPSSSGTAAPNTVGVVSPVSGTHMNAEARAFYPSSSQTEKQQPQQQPYANWQRGPSHNAPPAPGMLGGAAAGPQPNGADPWASYEMFARWRDMMEAYYQGMFAAQEAAGPAGSGALPLHAQSPMTTPSRPQ